MDTNLNPNLIVETDTNFKGHNRQTHLNTSARGGRAAHNPLKPKHKRCHEFTSKTASAAANKRWGNR